MQVRHLHKGVAAYYYSIITKLLNLIGVRLYIRLGNYLPSHLHPKFQNSMLKANTNISAQS